MADPREIRTRAEWTRALRALFAQAGLSYHVLAERCGVSTSTLHMMVAGQSFPRPSTVRLFVQACGERDAQPWVDARARVAAVETDRVPRGGIRVSEADPRQFGVHAAISVPGVSDEVPPEYVPRDVDTAEFGIQVKVAAAAQQGGFVVLVGGSSVGKTRSAFEAVTALLPDWWLVHPGGPGEVAELARAPLPRTVVWLDELDRYLGGEHGLSGKVVRRLLDAPHPLVIIGTLWPDWYNDYTAIPAHDGADRYAQERAVLKLAAVITISPKFSPEEQAKARAAADRDRRLRAALEAAGYGLTQTLAGAPHLVARWEGARTADPYAWAVLTAALDVARLGIRAPLSADFLRVAAVDYCTSEEQAEAPTNWFEQALAYATTKLQGAIAAMSPVGAGMGNVVGYTVADYLIQHTSRERRDVRVPASTLDAVRSHIGALADGEQALTIIRIRVRARDLDRSRARSRQLARGLTGQLDSAVDLWRRSESVLVGGLTIDDRDGTEFNDLDRAFKRANTLAGEFSQDLDREVTRTRDLAAALKRELSRAGDLAREVTRNFIRELTDVLDNDAERAGALVRHLDSDRARDLELALNRDGTLNSYLQVVGRLAAVPVDLSGADLSGEDLGDLEVLEDAIWSPGTIWPPEVAEQVLERSREIRPGAYQVHGRSMHDPPNRTTT